LINISYDAPKTQIVLFFRSHIRQCGCTLPLEFRKIVGNGYSTKDLQ